MLTHSDLAATLLGNKRQMTLTHKGPKFITSVLTAKKMVDGTTGGSVACNSILDTGTEFMNFRACAPNQ